MPIETETYKGHTITIDYDPDPLDPYCGSGTTPKVCKDLGRHFTGIDIQKGQCKFAKARISA